MKLGIDFGTTRIVVAFVDRGNYPVVVFESPDGNSFPWFPPLVAVKRAERRYGGEAGGAEGRPNWTVVGCVKRARGWAGPARLIQRGEQRGAMVRVLRELAL